MASHLHFPIAILLLDDSLYWSIETLKRITGCGANAIRIWGKLLSNDEYELNKRSFEYSVT